MGMEASLGTLANDIEPFRSQSKYAIVRLLLGSNDNGKGFLEEHLVGKVCVQIDRAEETLLAGMCVDPAQGNQIVKVLYGKDLFLTEHRTLIAAAMLLGHDQGGQGECVVRKLPGKNSASLDVVAGVGRGEFHEACNDCVRNHQRSQGQSILHPGCL